MDDWQEAAFNNRRIPHGRSKKGGKAGSRKGAGTFDPKQALGTYELSGNAVERLLSDTAGQKATFDIHEVTETPGGLTGSLVIRDKLRAALLLAGSRKMLSRLVEEAEEEAVEAAESEGASPSGRDDGNEDSQDGSDNDDVGSVEEARDRRANERIQAFEKNSFRSPKFWLQWQGDISVSTDGNNSEEVCERNQGYIIFSGNDCKDFQGTLSCKEYGWKDVAIRGRKVTSKASRPPPFLWSAV